MAGFAARVLEGAGRHLGEIIITTSAVAAFAAADWLLPDAVLEAVGRVASGRVVLGLVLAIVVLLALLIYRSAGLKYDRRLGTFADRSGTRYCPRCYVDRRRRMPLREYPKSWWCYTCSEEYSNPDKPADPAPARRMVSGGIGGWLDRWR